MPPKQITLTLQQFHQVTRTAAFHPHPRYRKGSLILKHNPKLPNQNRETCVLLSAGAIFDLTGNLTLHPWVYIANGAQIWTHSHYYQGTTPLLLNAENLSPAAYTYHIDKTIESDVWIYQAIILAKCSSIARGCIIATSAVVTKPITEPYTIWAGVPAKKIGHR